MNVTLWFNIVLSILVTIGINSCKDQDGAIEHFSEEVVYSSDLSAQKREIPSFELPVVGKNVLFKSNQVLGKNRLVVFFAPWCSSCLKGLEELQDIQNEIGKEKLFILAITVSSKVTVDLEKIRLTFPILAGNEKVQKDFGPIMGVPTGFLVDKNGLIVRKYSNHIHRKTLIADINTLLVD